MSIINVSKCPIEFLSNFHVGFPANIRLCALLEEHTATPVTTVTAYRITVTTGSHPHMQSHPVTIGPHPVTATPVPSHYACNTTPSHYRTTPTSQLLQVTPTTTPSYYRSHPQPHLVTIGPRPVTAVPHPWLHPVITGPHPVSTGPHAMWCWHVVTVKGRSTSM